MTAQSKPDTRNYDLAKAGVALFLWIVMMSMLVLRPGDQSAATETVPAPPAVPAIGAPQWSGQGGFVLSGSGEPGTVVELWDGEVRLAKATVGADGKWTLQGTLEPGDHALTARTVDAGGEVVNTSSPLFVSVPRPQPVIAAPEMGAPELAAGGGFVLSGSGEPGTVVELWDGEVRLAKATVGADGKWTLQGTLEPGDHMLTARTVGADGEVINESASLALTVPAPITVLVPTINEPRFDPATGLVDLGGAGQPGETLEILEDGAVVGVVIVLADGSWQFSYAATEGEHLVAVRVRGSSGPNSGIARLVVQPVAPGPAGSGEEQEVPAGGQAYVVQSGDWLVELSRRFLGDPSLYPLIIEETRGKAMEDPSFAVIWYPDLLRPGWKIWIPER